jgi:type IV secretory pathway VirD2 relaxase
VDRLTRYDEAQRVVQRDEDQDGDGLIDARAYYEDGRLVRRELVSESQGDVIDDEEDLTSAAWSSEPEEARP